MVIFWYIVYRYNTVAAAARCMQKPRLPGRGFCNKKRGEENEKDILNRLILVYSQIVKKKSG